MKINQILSEDYQIYRRWFELSLDLIWKIPQELRAKADPMSEIAKAEGKSLTMAEKALASGIKDTVAMTDRYSAGDIELVDEAFVKAGLPSLTAMRVVFSKSLLRIIKSSVVENEEDYCLLKSLEDCDLPEGAKNMIRKMCGAYEIKKY